MRDPSTHVPSEFEKGMLGAGLVHNENQLSSDIATLKDPATPVRTRGP